MYLIERGKGGGGVKGNEFLWVSITSDIRQKQHVQRYKFSAPASSSPF